MNEQNYASLEASKRLQDAGIVIETEVYWRQNRIDQPWKLVNYYRKGTDANYLPAPSMAEIWREFKDISITKDSKHFMMGESMVWQCPGDNPSINVNPTDALIYFRIWVEEQKP